MNIEILKTDLHKLLLEFIEENEVALTVEIDENTRLIGTTSIFDSMELVRFIVEVESFLDERYGIEMQLASENAMSRRNSPFISISTLLSYIADESES